MQLCAYGTGACSLQLSKCTSDVLNIVTMHVMDNHRPLQALLGAGRGLGDSGHYRAYRNLSPDAVSLAGTRRLLN